MTDELVESVVACIRLYATTYGLTASELRFIFGAGLRKAFKEGWLPRSIPVDDDSTFPGLSKFKIDGQIINLMDDGTFMTSDGKVLRRPN